MSYNTIETSLDGRTPIRLYLFKRGALTWAYNSSSQAIKRGTVLYKSVLGGLKDQGIIISDGGISDNFKITAPADIEIAKLFYAMPPSARIELEVSNTHLQTDDVQPVWWGVVTSVNELKVDEVEIVVSPYETIANRPGITLVYGRQCGALIYDNLCKVNKELYRVRSTVQQVNVTGIETPTAANYSDGYFNGGFVEYTITGGELERRYIEQHNSSSLILWGGSQGIEQGQDISLFPGCDTSTSLCNNQYQNHLNRQSFEHMQGTSPFDGNQVF